MAWQRQPENLSLVGLIASASARLQTTNNIAVTVRQRVESRADLWQVARCGATEAGHGGDPTFAPSAGANARSGGARTSFT